MRVLLYINDKKVIERICYAVSVNRNDRYIKGYEKFNGKRQRVLFLARFNDWYEIKVVDDEGKVSTIYKKEIAQ